MNARRLERARALHALTLGVTIALVVALSVPVRAQEASATEPPDPGIVRHGDDHTTVVVDPAGQPLTGPSKQAPAAIAQGWLQDHHAVFGLTAGEAGLFRVARDHALASGAHQVVLQQQVKGLDVDGGAITAGVDADGRLVMIGGRAGTLETRGAVALTAGQAIAAAARDTGVAEASPPPRSATRRPGAHAWDNPYAKDLAQPSDVTAELVWHITDDRSLRLAWRTEVEASGHNWHESLVDASTGEILAQEDLYSHHAAGTVSTQQHPGVPGYSRTQVAFTGIDGEWVDTTLTSGNNVNAYRDRDDNDSNDEFQPNEGDAHFDYAWPNQWAADADPTSESALDDDDDAGTTQVFWYVNDMHDWLYDLGFDEASGNFQVDNFGRGGSDSDPVLAENQDGWDFGCQDNAMPPNDIRCFNNANFGTNGDGSTARMQMYMWTTPYRDGSFDGDVVAHEYGHGVSNRLVPMTLSGATNQAGSLGEGWSDAISFLRWGDATVGEYVTGDNTGGVRNFNYDVHPWTYGDYSTSVTTPHRNGEIWGATMYDLRVMLGLNDDTRRLVLDGMRFTPNGPSPTFLDARDGILAADLLTNLGTNLCALWTVFAGRGMGTGAVSNGLHAVPTEDFTIPGTCLPTADADGPYSTDEGTDVVLDGSGSSPGSASSAGALVSHEWDFDDDGVFDDATGVNPTFDLVGQDGVYPVALRVTDAFGNTDVDTTTVTVDNVAPTVVVDAISPIDEFGTVTVSGTITDPGWLDVLTATIDFDDGAGAVGLTGSTENIRPDATLSFSVEHQYGDDGDFTVTVVGYDDDTSHSDSAVASVANVDPTVTIDTSGEQVYDGVSAFVLDAGDDLTVPVGVTDPGSDDLTTTWDWGDGTDSVEESLVNPPVADPPKSPSVQPRDIDVDATHTYGEACLYDLVVTSVDDDGGSGDDSATVLVVGNADQSRGSGYWLNQYRTKPPNHFTDAELACMLAIVNYLSMVFDGVDRAGAAELFHDPAKNDAEIQFDQQALAAWLNFANGSISLDSPVDTDGDGIDDTTFGDAMLLAETTRLGGTQADIRTQKDIVESLLDQEAERTPRPTRKPT